MSLSSLNLPKFIFNTTNCNYFHHLSYYKTKSKNIGGRVGLGGRCCSSAIAINTPSSLSGVSGIRWGSTKLQGAREEMEDDVVIVKSSSDHGDCLDGFSFAAVFDGHAGYSSVKFLRDELYRECVTALQGGILLTGKNFNVIKKALQDAFQTADEKLINWFRRCFIL